MLKFSENDYEKLDAMNLEVWVRMVPRQEAEKTLSKGLEKYIEVLQGKVKYEKGIEKILKHCEYFFRVDYENEGKQFQKLTHRKNDLFEYWKAKYKIGENNSHVYEYKIEISMDYAVALLIHLASSPYALGMERVEQIVQDHNLPLNLFNLNEIKEII